MELRHLTYFTKVAELRSVSKAAAVLHMTQPALSRQILALERELGCSLFVRTAHGVTLTSEGAGLARHLEVVFAQLQRIPEVVRIAAEHREPVRVGVPQGLPHDWALRLLRAVEEHVPAVALSLHEATTEEQRHQLQSGLLDLGLIHMDAPELRSVQVLVQPMGLAVPPGSALEGRDVLTFADLDRLKVMAHAVGEVNIEEIRLRSASTAAGVDTHWVFRRFSEHSSLIAMTAGVDAVLATKASALRHLPAWTWIPVTSDAENRRLDLRTWLTWSGPLTPNQSAVVDVMVAHSSTGPDDGGWELLGDRPGLAGHGDGPRRSRAPGSAE